MKRKNLFKLSIKQKVRIRLKKLRSAIKPLVLSIKSRKIMRKLFSLPEFKKAKSIMFYVSFGSEVNTHRMIKKALKLNKKVFVPITDFKNKHLSISRIREFPGCLEASSFGILEPAKSCREIYTGKKLDLIIVPGVGFDYDGNRMGYGGGFYDRLLLRIKAYSIGIAFDFQVVKTLPIEGTDKKLNLVLTEKTSYKKHF